MLDKKEIEKIRTNAERAKNEFDIKERKEKEKITKDFLSLITGSCDLNSQIKTQWTNKVFKDFTKPIHFSFQFDINSIEFGITEQNIFCFKSALSEYLFSLGFAFYSGNSYGHIAYHREMKEVPHTPLVRYFIEKRSLFKRLFKFPTIYKISSLVVYGK